MEHPPYDPREFTPAEWSLIIKALQGQGAWLAKKADRSFGHVYEGLAAASGRHFELARRAVNARIWARDHAAGKDEEPG